MLLEPVELPAFLRDKLYADFTTTDRFKKTFPQLLKALGIRAEVPGVTRAPEVEPPPMASQTPAERRLTEFEDIRILDLDDAASYNPDPQYALYNMYFTLSRTPPEEWQQIFEAARRFPRHTMWLRAWIEASRIVIYCVPDELERYHLRDLLEDVKNANAKYRQYLVELARRETQEHNQFTNEREQLRELRRRLGFG